MARAAAKRSKSAKPDARKRRSRGRAAPLAEQQMFFPRLRRQAKWIFAGIAVVFAISFSALGVGSGSTGIGDLFSNGKIFGFDKGSANSGLNFLYLEYRLR